MSSIKTMRRILNDWKSLSPKEQRVRGRSRVYAKAAGRKTIGEVKCEILLHEMGLKPQYEKDTFEYTIEGKNTPDWRVNIKNVQVEYKGKLTDAVRRKLRAVKRCNPDLILIIIFEDASKKLKKGSPTSYGKWATDNGFYWVDWKDDKKHDKLKKITAEIMS